MRKAKVYKATTDDANKFFDLGWEILPMSAGNGGMILYKWVKLRKDSKAVKALINAYDVNADLYKGPFMQYLYELGIHFVEGDDGKRRVSLTEDGWESVRMWRIEFDVFSANRFVRLHPNDFTFPNPFYPADVIGKYVEKPLAAELESGLIEVVEVIEEDPASSTTADIPTA